MKKILSIDGGGIRGLIPALVLAEVERQTGKAVSELFDLIAGTSTGGILALGLCIPGPGNSAKYSADKMAELYTEYGRHIFGRSFWKGVSSVGGLADEKYSHEPLAGTLGLYFKAARMHEALTHVFVSAYDIAYRKPFFIKSWKEETALITMKAAARATSAAPTYFEPALIDIPCEMQPLAFIDGGVCVNNPALCAYAEARRLWPAETEFLVVSLGSGENTRPILYDEARSWGLIEWARPVLSVIMDGMSDAVDYQLRQILGENFFRFQTRLLTASDDMDNASASNLMALREEAGLLIVNEIQPLTEACNRLVA